MSGRLGKVLIAHETVINGGLGCGLPEVIAESEACGHLEAPYHPHAGCEVPFPSNRDPERYQYSRLRLLLRTPEN